MVYRFDRIKYLILVIFLLFLWMISARLLRTQTPKLGSTTMEPTNQPQEVRYDINKFRYDIMTSLASYCLHDESFIQEVSDKVVWKLKKGGLLRSMQVAHQNSSRDVKNKPVKSFIEEGKLVLPVTMTFDIDWLIELDAA